MTTVAGPRPRRQSIPVGFLLKLSGDVRRSRRSRPGRGAGCPADRGRRPQGSRGRSRRRRRLLFRGAELQQKGWALARRLHGHAGHRRGTAWPSRASLEEGGIDTRSPDGHHDGSGRRTVHSAARHSPPSEGPGRHLRGRRRYGCTSTDTVSCPASLEVQCDEVLMSKHGVDGVHDSRSSDRPPPSVTWLQFHWALRSGLGRRCCRLQPVHGEQAADGGLRHGWRGRHHPRPAGTGSARWSRRADPRAPAGLRDWHLTRDKAEVTGDRTGATKRPERDDRREPVRAEEDGRPSGVAKGPLPASARVASSGNVPSSSSVDYYGAPTPLQLASVETPRPSSSSSAPSTSPRCTPSKAIQQADLGGIVNDGNIIPVCHACAHRGGARGTSRWPSARAEEAHVSVHNIRRHAKEAIEVRQDGEGRQERWHRGE